MVSAICPQCKILLVEADDNSFANLGAAVVQAAALGANAISNSYGAREFPGAANYEGPYNQPGVAVTVSSGDSGYGVSFPASSRYVTAVGGTSLTRSSGVWSETVWSGAGSGCSSQIAKPSWQLDTGCARRTVADVAAVADPNTGVLVYQGGQWWQFGGTSVASPIIASVYALAGSAGNRQQHPYDSHRSNPNNFRDITSGINGRCGSPATRYLCTGIMGYDGPTGLGTPRGVGGF